MTLLSVVIPLTATNTPEEQAFLGRQVHAWFLDQVKAADAAMAEFLHAAHGDKPFTASGLVSGERPWLVQPEVREGQQYYVRLTSIDEELSALMLEQMLPALPDEIQLGVGTFRVEPPLTQSEEHPWAATLTADELVTRWFGPRQRPQRAFVLEFASPTAIRRIKRNVLLPWPAGVLGSYLRAWNAHCRPVFDEALLELVEAEVLVTRYELTTKVVNYGSHQISGWMGKCRYTIFHREKSVQCALNLLADFAQFCGTGYKTTQGMGQTRLIPSPKS